MALGIAEAALGLLGFMAAVSAEGVRSLNDVGLLTPSALPADEAGFPQRRWMADQAWDWYKKQPWLVGFNYIPSTACNTTEFWQAETFDEKTIDRELGWAQGLGFNTCRVFVQYLVWKQDPEGLKSRLDRFLAMADARGISTMPVLFDDCSFGDPPQTEPYLGKQRDPVPGMIAPSWTPSPGLKAVVDKAAWPDLEKYVKDVVGRFGRDRRVVVWDLYNEPGNSRMGNKSLPLVEAAFAWARQAGPSQPMTIGVWGAPAEISNRQLDLSDVVTFHFYGNYKGLAGSIGRYKALRRPVICTEWMARPLGSRWDTDLPLLKRMAVGCYNWGLVNGRMQCQFPWNSPRGAPEPTVWFHDLFHKDGRPYDAAEHDVIRKTTADKKIDWEALEFQFSPGWTLWTGQGPEGGMLHYANAAGQAATITVEGSRVSLVHKVGPDCGIAYILIDGKPAIKANGGALEPDAEGKAALDTYGPAVEWNRRTPVAEGLAPGRHTLTVTVAGRKHAASTNTYVQIVGLDVGAAPPK